MIPQITLDWNASTIPGATYNIYRKPPSQVSFSTVPLNTAPITSPTYQDTTVIPGFQYDYAVTTVSNGVESPLSVLVESASVPFAPSPVSISLGTASSFGVLAGSAITNTGNTTVIGDVGISPGTSITGMIGGPGSITGAYHVADFVASGAQNSLLAAYTAAKTALNPGGAPATTLTGDIGGDKLTPGGYPASRCLGITGTLILDAQGNPDAVWIFQIGSTLTTAASNSDVVLINGAQAGNVYWQGGSSPNPGISTSFSGIVMAQTSITANAGAVIDGQLLAITGAVTLNDNSISMFLLGTLV